MTISFVPENGKKFRIIGVDTFSDEDWLIDDVDTITEARELTDEHGGTMLKTHVYDKNGCWQYEAGTF